MVRGVIKEDILATKHIEQMKLYLGKGSEEEYE